MIVGIALVVLMSLRYLHTIICDEQRKMDHVILKVGVVGGGTMGIGGERGGGIVPLIARQGVPVVLKEANEELEDQARKRLDAVFSRWYDLNKIDRGRLEQLKSLVEVTSKSEDLADAQLVIEAVPEVLDLKKNVFQELDAILPRDAIIVSNTSCLSITEIARSTSRPEQVAGMHFFNPPTRMALIELVKGKNTSRDTMDIIKEFSIVTLRKLTIQVVDRPGFFVNTILLPYLNEAVFALEETTVSPHEIEKRARAFGWPQGPFTLLDFIGLDTALFVAHHLQEAYGARMEMASLFEKLVHIGRLGDKVGAGFFVTTAEGNHEPVEAIIDRLYPNRRTDVSADHIFHRMMCGLLNETVRALEEGVTSRDEIELGAATGIGCPKEGPLHIIDGMGIDTLLTDLEEIEKKSRGSVFRPCGLLREMALKGEKFFSAW